MICLFQAQKKGVIFFSSPLNPFPSLYFPNAQLIILDKPANLGLRSLEHVTQHGQLMNILVYVKQSSKTWQVIPILKVA